jgi:hypothetical protein
MGAAQLSAKPLGHIHHRLCYHRCTIRRPSV